MRKEKNNEKEKNRGGTKRKREEEKVRVYWDEVKRKIEKESKHKGRIQLNFRSID